MRGHRSGFPLAMAVAVVAAGAATVILRPRGGLIEPAAVDAAAYFSQAQLDRASEFREVQRLIGLGGLAVSGGTLALLALRPPRGDGGADGARRPRPVLGGAAVGAGLSLALVVTGLPLSLWAHERAVDVGLSTQSLGEWLGDVALSAAIGAVTGAIGGAVAMALIRRFPRRWWIPGRRRCDRLRGAGALPVADPDRSAVQQVRAAAAGRAAIRCGGAGRSLGGRRGGGLPGGCQPPYHRHQRLRGRDRPHQAGGALRQPDRGLPGRPGALGSGPRAGPRAQLATCREGCSGSRSWRPRGCCSSSGWRS